MTDPKKRVPLRERLARLKINNFDANGLFMLLEQLTSEIDELHEKLEAVQTGDVRPVRRMDMLQEESLVVVEKEYQEALKSLGINRPSQAVSGPPQEEKKSAARAAAGRALTPTPKDGTAQDARLGEIVPGTEFRVGDKVKHKTYLPNDICEIVPYEVCRASNMDIFREQLRPPPNTCFYARSRGGVPNPSEQGYGWDTPSNLILVSRAAPVAPLATIPAEPPSPPSMYEMLKDDLEEKLRRSSRPTVTASGAQLVDIDTTEVEMRLMGRTFEEPSPLASWPRTEPVRRDLDSPGAGVIPKNE